MKTVKVTYADANGNILTETVTLKGFFWKRLFHRLFKRPKFIEKLYVRERVARRHSSVGRVHPW